MDIEDDFFRPPTGLEPQIIHVTGLDGVERAHAWDAAAAEWRPIGWVIPASAGIDLAAIPDVVDGEVWIVPLPPKLDQPPKEATGGFVIPATKMQTVPPSDAEFPFTLNFKTLPAIWDKGLLANESARLDPESDTPAIVRREEP